MDDLYVTNAQYATEDEREKSFLNLVWHLGNVRTLIVLILTYENSLKDTGLILIRTGGACGQNSGSISLDGKYNNKT